MNSIAEMRAALLDGRSTPEEEVAAAYQRFDESGDPAIVIAEVPRERAMVRARELARLDPAGLPLYGIPFAVKDNIDVAGVDTTAGCPAYAYRPSVDAAVIERLMVAGAIPVVKTNLDQFATGLVGTRSPYGIPRLPWAPDLVPGGSSSGSGVAVARSLVPFALGTDTAGSGRVPAAFGGIVGIKPRRGSVSSRGVVPAIRALDCVSIFAGNVADGTSVLDVMAGFDPSDPMSRIRRAATRDHCRRVGIAEGVAPWVVAALGSVSPTESVGLDAFIEIGEMLYGGPWVAARYASVGAFVREHGDGMDPTVRSIILNSQRWTAADVMDAELRLAELARGARIVWDRVDVIVAPTTPRHPTIAEVMDDPIGVNSELGRFTNFVNLLDLCAVAVPPNLTVIAPAWCEVDAIEVAAQLAGRSGVVDRVELAVVGAHLRGEPLHHQLVDLDARFLAETHTAAQYRLFALANTTPPKPGLVRQATAGAAIEVEVYSLECAAFGRFVAAVPPPLAIGSVVLADGRTVRGFVCEPAGLANAIDITHLGGWRQYGERSAVARSG